MRGDVSAVETLLERGADVNAARGDGMTALHWAAEHGNADLADMLVRAGANLNAVTRIGAYTPLHVAARAGGSEVVRLLAEAGADLEARAANSGATALHLASAAGDVASIRFLVAEGADVDAREHQWGQTPLVFAAGWNRADAIQALLEAGADPDLTTRVVDLEEQEDLYQAAEERRDDLLDAFTGGEDGRPPTPSELKAAIEAGREIIRSGELEEEPEPSPFERFRGPPTILKKGGLTPLLHAVRQGHHEAMVALLDGGADVNKVSESDGTSPLLMATINGQFDAAVFLLERGADPNLAATLNEVTPLWAAINSQWQPRTRYPQPQERSLQETGYLQLAEALLEAGADPDARISLHPWYLVYTGCGNGNCGLVDMRGSTAFWRAAYATDVEAMKLLAEHGADPHLPTTAGNMMSFSDYRRLQVVEELEEEAFQEKDAEGKAQALRTARGDLPEEMQAEWPDSLVNADPDAYYEEIKEAWEHADSVAQAKPDPSGLPPVKEGDPAVYPIHAASGVGYGEGFAGNAHRHVPDGWMETVRYLVEELGADVNMRDANGYTALHHAASRGDNEMIRYLVEMGADVTVVSREGQTTADMANGPVQRVSPFPETVALLERLGSRNNHNCQSC
jgi:ankyrin repeat protein